MPSQALQLWRANRSGQLDEIEAAHRAVGGSARGRRYATQQINRAYAVLLSSHFQGFCRDLHTECADHFIGQIANPKMQAIVESNFYLHRRLDTGNPNSGNIGADFNRFDFKLWDEVSLHDAANDRRKRRLDELNNWRNAIAHQDFDPLKLGSLVLLIKRVRIWRTACDDLASSFDAVIQSRLIEVTGAPPW